MSGSDLSVSALSPRAENAPETGHYGRYVLTAVSNRPIPATRLDSPSCHLETPALVGVKAGIRTKPSLATDQPGSVRIDLLPLKNLE